MRRHLCPGFLPAVFAAPWLGLVRPTARRRLVLSLLVGLAVPAIVRAETTSRPAGAAATLPVSSFAQAPEPNDGDQADDPDAPTAAEEWPYVAVRAVSYVALIALVGAIVVVPAMTNSSPPGSVPRAAGGWSVPGLLRRDG